jgi:hypothetical protein
MERREPSFPVTLVLEKPSRYSPGSFQMYYAHEWEALQKASQALQPGLPSDPATQAEPANPAVPSQDAANSVVPSFTSFTSTPFSTSYASVSLPPDFSRHSRLCSICTHPDRDLIEGDFIRWRSPVHIARDFKISDRSAIYRHAHSTGLFARRRSELGRVLEGILEAAEHVPLESSDVIIRAARVYSHLDDSGHWIEPSRVNFVLTGPAFGHPTSIAARAPRRVRSKKSNRNSRGDRKSAKSKNRKEKANS